MKRVRCNPIVRADLHKIKWLMVQLPIADRTLKGRSADQSESKPMEGSVQAFSEHRAQRWHGRLFVWWVLDELKLRQGDSRALPTEDHRDDFLGNRCVIDESKVLVGRS